MQSTDSSDPVNLSPAQAQVVAALAQGRTVTAAAQGAGLHRNTIYNWLHEPAFKTAVEEAEHEYVAILSDGMRDLAALALDTLRALLEDPKTPPAVRLRTALAILQRPHFPDRGWHLPERIEPPQEQQVVDGLATVKADYDAMRMTVGQVPDLPNQPIARNAPCPCASGLKYKRCCGATSRGKRNLPNSAQGVAARSPVGQVPDLRRGNETPLHGVQRVAVVSPFGYTPQMPLGTCAAVTPGCDVRLVGSITR